MTFFSSTRRPEVLGPLEADLDRTEQIMGQLERELDPSTRAELVSELIRLCSLIEDTMERSVYELLDDKAPDLASRAYEESTRLRTAMVPLDHRVRHVDASDVRRTDPEGFERELTELRETLMGVRAWEIAELYPFLTAIASDERPRVHAKVASARHHASEHPAPAGPIGRLVHKIGAKMDRYPDTADRDHAPPHRNVPLG
jgi:hypothetical protein